MDALVMGINDETGKEGWSEVECRDVRWFVPFNVALQ